MSILGILALIALLIVPCYLCLLDKWDLEATIKKMPVRVQKTVDKIWLYLFGDEMLAKLPKQPSNTREKKSNYKEQVEYKLDCSYCIFRKFVEFKHRYQSGKYSICKLTSTKEIELNKRCFNVVNKPLDNPLLDSSDSSHIPNSSTGENDASTKTEPNL
jgi:hypothetical protein